MKLKINNDQKQAGLVKIERETPIALVVEKYPDVAEVLTEDYGFHCVGCFASSMETIEQGATVHGMNNEEIDEMLVKINKLL